MSAASHETHEDHGHTHGEGCGHVAVAHGDHTDYLHDGHAHFEHVGAVIGKRHENLRGPIERRIPGGDVRHQSGTPAGLDRGEALGNLRHAKLLRIVRHVRILSFTLSTSLSPRPDRFTRRIASFGKVGASLHA